MEREDISGGYNAMPSDSTVRRSSLVIEIAEDSMSYESEG
jgi:hypothetical protein